LVWPLAPRPYFRTRLEAPFFSAILTLHGMWPTFDLTAPATGRKVALEAATGSLVTALVGGLPKTLMAPRLPRNLVSVIRDAMKKKKMVGIGRVVMARRERVMMLEPFGKGIMGTTLHYPYEIRSEESVFEEIPEMKLPDQMVGLAEEIIDRMSGEFEPQKFEDRYENAMIELIRSKQAGLPPPKEKPAARPANVVNLMDALRRSIE
jgi:hypothetical protein